MSEDIYQRLREDMNSHGLGYPATTTGAEIKLLKRLFSEEDARMYGHLTDDLETPQQIAERTNQDPDQVAHLLESMAKKGLLFLKRKGDISYYAAAPLAHGIAEHQVKLMDKEMAQLFNEYNLAEKVFEEEESGKWVATSLPLRPIPVNTPVNVSAPIAPYENVREIIKSQDRIAVADCLCRVKLGLLGEDCDQPLEVCLLLGFYADYYVDLGWGRRIDQEEALRILDMAEEAGLVHQVPICEDPGAICNCCPDCCALLSAIKLLPNPAAFVNSDHFAQVNTDLCTACETCLDRCPVDAISIGKDQVAGINLERCIGCGLCINTCPDGALVLAAKPDRERTRLPFTSPFMRSSKDIESKIK